MDDYEKIQNASNVVYSADLWGCTRCGIVVFDKEKHDEIFHSGAS